MIRVEQLKAGVLYLSVFLLLGAQLVAELSPGDRVRDQISNHVWLDADKQPPGPD